MTKEDLMKLPAYKKFQELLEELFQFDLADLDFGLYRVLRSRREAVQKYLAENLPQKLAEELETIGTASKEDLLHRMGEVRSQVRRLAPNALDDQGNLTDVAEVAAVQLGGELVKWIKQYKEFQEELRTVEENLKLTEEQVNDVLLLIYDFFTRYYDEGDFIPMPRLSSGENYSLKSYGDPSLAPESGDFSPPNFHGEEIFFHWPTRGMHYVKTDTFLKNYSFEVRTGEPEPKRYKVRFVLDQVEAVSDNNKVTRYFFPKPEGLRLDNDTLLIPLDYRRKQEGDGSNQQKIFETILSGLLEAVPDPTLRAALGRPEGEKNESLLLRRLKHFAALGSKDFFVHPYLRAFLERELDYFVKSQAWRTAHLFTSPEVLQHRIRVLKALYNVTLDIIGFLDQLEQVQARLFEKKRLVYRADYIVSIRFVPCEFWSEILENEDQLKAWKDDMGLEGSITQATLETHPTLPLYTGYFDESFKRRLLQKLPFEDLDEATDGLLVHAENYGALRTLEASFKGKVVVCIDPPFNSKASEILYKNGYKHSTWLTLIEERLRLSKQLEAPFGSHVIAIDHNEQEKLGILLREIFPQHSIYLVSVVHNKKGRQGDHFSQSNEYAYFAISSRVEEVNEISIPQEEWEWDNLRKWGSESERNTAKNCFYPIYVKEGQVIGFGEVCADDFHPSSANVFRPDGVIEVYPVDSAGVERKWRYSRETVPSILHLLKVRTTNHGEIQILKAKATAKPKTVWDSSAYIAGDYGTRLLTEMGIKTDDNLYPKSIYTVRDSLFIIGDASSIFLDYFAGSGTTGHAVINLNREDGGYRKFILVEMGEYFDTVLLRRIQKVIYAPEWRNGKPKDEPKVEVNEESRLPDWMERSPRLIKVLRLESYDDSLFNLDEAPSEREKAILSFVKEKHYLLQYFSDVILDGNPTVMRPKPLETWKEPENIRVKRPMPGIPAGFTEECVDWLETVALWLGVRLKRYREFVANGRTYRVFEGELGGEKVALVLRNARDLAPEEDRKALKENLEGFRIIVNVPLVAEFEAMEDCLEAALWEGPK